MDLEALVAEARERRPQPMPPRERAVAGAIAVAFLAACAGLNVLIPHAGAPADPLVLLALVAVYAIAHSVSFEIGSGDAAPTQLVFIPMLFLAPLPLVPLLMAVGSLIGRIPSFFLQRSHPDRWLHCFGSGWNAVGPALVLGLLAPGPPEVKYVAVYALALACQVAIGLGEAVVGDRLMYGTAPLRTLQAAAWAYRIDVILTPAAFMVAAVATREPLAVAAVLPLIYLLQTFSRERKERYAAALELSQAYRGTVMVLSDVVEADDNYTADHCRSVVELAASVGEEMRLGYEAKQELEIAALLHDVGKIAIPNEVINKPARLTEDEFELMKTHTIEGQALLNRVGGRLARIGEIVRSCHERWDGCGYPDGLAGEEIPLAARIVFCCDAYSAMTTDRPYRAAMDKEAALRELSDNSGTQFEPTVVAALTRVITTGEHATGAEYSDAVRAVLAGQSPVARVELSA